MSFKSDEFKDCLEEDEFFDQPDHESPEKEEELKV